MFVNMFLLSLLTIIYGTKCDEGGGSAVEANSLHYRPELSQQRLNDDLNFIKTARSIRTPFRNTEIMTARGFGKRSGEEQEYNESYNEKKVNDDYRDEALANHLKQKQHLFPFTKQFLRSPEEFSGQDNVMVSPVKSHRLQIRDGTLKFRLNDGNLRIGRGFGKRSFGDDPYIENFRAMQLFRQLSQNQQLSPNSVREEA